MRWIQKPITNCGSSSPPEHALHRPVPLGQVTEVRPPQPGSARIGSDNLPQPRALALLAAVSWAGFPSSPLKPVSSPARCRVRRGIRRALCLVLVCVVGAFSRSSQAAGPRPITTRLEWGSSVCGDAEGFESRVLKRTRNVRFVTAREQLTVRLSIAPKGAALDARVTLQSKGRPAVSRRIASPDCNDALDALALVVAISLEARAQEAVAKSARPRRPRSVEQPKAPPPPLDSGQTTLPPGGGATTPAATTEAPEGSSVAPPTASGLTSSEKAAAPTPAPALSPLAEAPAVGAVTDPAAPIQSVPVVSQPAPVVPARPIGPPSSTALGGQLDSAPTAEAPARPWAMAGGVAAAVSFGVSPNALIGGQLWVRTGWQRDSLVSPELLLAVAHQVQNGFVQAEANVDFTLDSASAELCPIRLGGSVLELRPCAGLSLGRLHAAAHRTFAAKSAQRPWGLLGASAQLAAHLGPVELRAAFGMGLPLVRDGFRIGSPDCTEETCQDEAFHRVKSVVSSLGLGVGLGFR